VVLLLLMLLLPPPLTLPSIDQDCNSYTPSIKFK